MSRTNTDAESTTLPPALRSAAAEFLNADPPATTREWARSIRETLAPDRELGVDSLCHASEATPHVAHARGETHHFLCPLDGVVLAKLVGAATVETACPTTGATLEVRVDGETVEATPESAVFSVGMTADPSESKGAPTPALAYGAVCPHVRGFASPAAYREWAARREAPSVAIDPREALGVAGALTGE